MIFEVTRHLKCFIEARNEEEATVLSNLRRFSTDYDTVFPERPYQYCEWVDVAPFPATSAGEAK